MKKKWRHFISLVISSCRSEITAPTFSRKLTVSFCKYSRSSRPLALAGLLRLIAFVLDFPRMRADNQCRGHLRAMTISISYIFRNVLDAELYGTLIHRWDFGYYVARVKNIFLSVFISFDNLLDDSHSNCFSFVTESESAHAWEVIGEFHCDLARQSESHHALVSLLEESSSGELLQLLCLSVELAQESLDSDFFDCGVEVDNSSESLAEKIFLKTLSMN